MSSATNSPTIINAGYLQFEPVLGNQDENMSRISKLLELARGAQLIVIPELANSGYNFESKDQAFQLADSFRQSSYIQFLIDISHKLNLNIVSGFLEEENDKLYNTSVLIGPHGFIGKYRKIHLFWNEFDFFERGNLGLPVFDIGVCKIGMLICFDWIFPEAWRILAIKGADIICHPSNLVLPYAQQAVPVQSMMNRVFIITANRYGSEGDITFSGKSIISDPTGQTVKIAPTNSDEVYFTEIKIEHARNKQITPRNHVFDDRIPEEYREILS
jgi:predicted amidohydrolase